MSENKYVKACELYENKEFDKSFQIYFNLASNNHIDSKKVIANMLLHGIGTVRDEEMAYYWYAESANEGDAESQYWYGNHLLSLNNIDDAIHWLSMSSENNYLDATYDLGQYYYNGKYVAKDIQKGIDFYEDAALQGHKEALDALIFAISSYKGKFQAFITIIKIASKLLFKDKKCT